MKKRGYLEIISGGMYSGKSEELIRRLKRCSFANIKFQLFKPEIDNRYSENKVVTHDKDSQLSALSVSTPKELISLVESDTTVVGIDEVQFFDETIVEVIEQLNEKGIRVVAAGLDMYSTGEPFGSTGILMAKAKYVSKLHAVCVVCGNNAYISKAISENDSANNESTVKVGSVGDYVAVCENCK
ncbi:thymidine kinase [Bacillus phage G]|uniref:Thymidine kinase n=1 Tax=Bacillus phage G TaxID=2884420 RepID=G3MBK1_9CAUD|nr:thymidine kinase [Bacillus phage G]AEO93397.1 gp135 [Bacillus phage G]